MLSQLSYTPLFPGVFSDPQKLNNVAFLNYTLVDPWVFFGYELYENLFDSHVLLRKEVIQPHLPIRLPCYDLTPVIESTFGCALLAVTLQTSGVPDSHGLTGGVYKARERIHRSMLTCDY